MARLDSAGAEVVGVQCEVRDPTTGEPVPDGEPGEVWVCGPNVMLGYWRREEGTPFVREGGRLVPVRRLGVLR